MKQVYLDNQSNTKLDERIFDVMKPFFFEYYGNPQSIYSLGSISKEALETARKQVADYIHADANEIIFTSCGTEANNLAVKGICEALKSKGNHIVVSAIEHFSVLNAVKKLQKDGFEATYISVDEKGNVSETELLKALRKDTVLVSIQHSNTEVGTIQDIKKLASTVKNSKVNDFVVFHTDAVSSGGMMPIDVKGLGVDALTLSSSAMYGPKGAAALYLKKGIRIVPQMDGGVQEYSKRAGTENIPAIVGFGKACEIAKEETAANNRKIKELRDKLIEELPKRIEYVYLNGALENRLVGNVNFSIEFVEGEALFLLLDAKGIMAASGSACANKNLKMSHVLDAMKVDVAVGQGSILFTLSKYNTEEEINYVLEEFPKIVKRLREMSPLYSYFIQTGKRKPAGPGADFDDHNHCHCDIEIE
ncbi:MAG: cysteine desulfurase [Endomicrobium sp.]|jgi:cysteine desulfurase|nr:cysteine desulfurase [Endomicrobium sp.]